MIYSYVECKEEQNKLTIYGIMSRKRKQSIMSSTTRVFRNKIRYRRLNVDGEMKCMQFGSGLVHSRDDLVETFLISTFGMGKNHQRPNDTYR